MQHNMMKLSASLSFLAVFSIGPMLLVIIFVSNLFFQRQAVEGSLYIHIRGFVGEKAAFQIQEIIKDASIMTHNLVAYISILILLIAATGVFNEIHHSINVIWNLQSKKGRGLLNIIKSRGMSFIIITALGLLLMLSLFFNSFLEGFRDKIRDEFPNIGFSGIYITNILITLIVVAALFAFIYKVLPDAFIKWRDVLPGAIFTSFLFMTGKFGISFYMKNSSVISAYNSAGSMIILLIWIFYSSMVLYYGAEFTKAYILKYAGEVKPRPYATTIKITKVITDAGSIQENERSHND